MSERTPRRLLRRLLSLSLGWLFAAAFYLLLIDITDLPELIVGAVAALLAAVGMELARESETPQALRAAWLARLYRPLLRAPQDIALVSLRALVQVGSRQRARGQFRAVPFRLGDSQARLAGRSALAEALGSFAPNTIIVGVDGERGVILAHQLRPTGGREAIDPLELG